MSARQPWPRWFVPALALATVVVAWPLALPVLYDTHDGHYALYNAAQLDRALRDGQLPVRWLPDLHGGRGIPLFVYYHPLAFYVVAGLHALGLSFVAATKLLYALTLPLSGWAAAAWLRAHLAARAAALGGLAYVLAPFRAVEIHVKGDPPAALAYVFVPLLLLAIARTVGARAARDGVGGAPARSSDGTVAGGAPAGGDGRWTGLAAALLLAAASAGLVLAHTVTALMVVPAAAAYAVALLGTATPGRGAMRLWMGVLLGAGLSCWAWLPAWVERPFVRIDSVDGILFFDWREHFVAWWQWLSPLWGYHGSFAGTRDDMSFQLGPVHAAGIAVAAWAVISASRVRRTTAPLGPVAASPVAASSAAVRLAAWAGAVTALALVAMLPVSRPLWEAVTVLRFVQFPWRLLAVVTLTSAALVAWAEAASPRRLLLLACVLPPGIAAAFALLERNRLYAVLAAALALAAGAVLLAHRALASRRPAAAWTAPCVAAMLLVAAVPWSAVPLHAHLKGDPKVVPLHEADLAPERVRLGIRRTTARWDYLPRTVRAAPPLDPAQEYLPPAGAVPGPDLTVLEGSLERASVTRGTASFLLHYASSAPARVALTLHAFPGWAGRLDPGTPAARPLPSGVDAEGRITATLPAGTHRARWTFERTWDRRLAERISLAAAALWAVALAAALVPRARRHTGRQT